MMKQSDWSHYLSLNNPWTTRLLGLEGFSRKKSIEEIEREYNREKYGKLLEFDFNDVELYKLQELDLAGLTQDSKIFISFKESLFEMKLSLARIIYNSLIFDTVKKYKPKLLCELGCGYGYNFSYLKNITYVYGGEFSQNAVTLGNKIGFDVIKFNFYDLEDYRIIKPSSVVLTVASVVCLPTAKCFIDGLYRNRDSLDVIINFEPLFLNQPSSFIDMIRNQYIDINDYNKDLFDLVTNRKDDIEILEFQQSCIGMNPLLPISLLVWKFK